MKQYNTYLLEAFNLPNRGLRSNISSELIDFEMKNESGKTENHMKATESTKIENHMEVAQRNTTLLPSEADSQNIETENQSVIQQNNVNSFSSNGAISESIAIQNSAECFQGIDNQSLRSNGAISESSGRENHIECTQQNDVNLPCSTEAPNNMNDASVDNARTEAANNNPLKDKLLYQFITAFSIEFLRKLKKYHKVGQRLVSSSTDNSAEIIDALILAISLADKAFSGSGMSSLESGILRTGFNKLNTFYSRRKSSKVIKAFSVEINERKDEFDYRRCMLIIFIIACDVCRMKQQQIHSLYVESHDYSLLAFVKDCVDRLVRRIHYGQGTVAKYSSFWERIVRKVPQDKRESVIVSKIRNYKDIENEAEMQEITQYVIKGLSERAKRKIVRRATSGKRVQVISATNKDKRLRISCNNLLHRTYIKVHNEYHFPSKNDSILKRVLGNIPGRLINHHEDKVSKDCGYSLPSLIYPDLGRNKPFIKSEVPNENSFPNNEILGNIANFKELMAFAKSLYDYCRIDETLRDIRP